MARGFGNSPAGDMTLPDGNIPGITNVRYAGMVPYRNGVTNPPITTPQFPNNAPRATNKSPIALHPVVDNLTLTRPTHTMLGSIPAGGYRGAVGQVVRSTDQNVGAGLRGVMVSGRLGSHAPQGYRGYASFGGLSGPTAGEVDLTGGGSRSIPNVQAFKVVSGAQYIVCSQDASKTLLILALPVAGRAQVTYTTGTASTPVETTININITEPTTGEAIQNVLTSGKAIADGIAADLRARQEIAVDGGVDWQDASFWRASNTALVKCVTNIRKGVWCGEYCMETQCDLILRILATANADENKHFQTLREILVAYSNKAGIPIELAIGKYVGRPGGDEPFKVAAVAAASNEFTADFAAVFTKIANTVVTAIGTAMPAFALLAAAICLSNSIAAEALSTVKGKHLFRKMAKAIETATWDAEARPVRTAANAMVTSDFKIAAMDLLVQANQGYRGTPSQEQAFKLAYDRLRATGLNANSEDTGTSVASRTSVADLIAGMQKARPDLMGLSSPMAGLLANMAPSVANDPLMLAGARVKFAAISLNLILTNQHQRGQALVGTPAAVSRFQAAWAAYTPLMAAAPRPLPLVFIPLLTDMYTFLAYLERTAPGVLRAAGVPTAVFPNGYAEFLGPPPPAGVVNTRGRNTLLTLIGQELPPAPPSVPLPPDTVIDFGPTDEPNPNPGTGPADNSGAGGDTDQPKASSNTPMLIGGAVVLGIGAFLLLRK